MPHSTILGLIAQHGKRNANRIAIASPGCAGLSYGALDGLIKRTGATLNDLGLGRGDVVALVLPNGPEMATALLSVMSYSTVAPLNSNYRASEFDFYIRDVGARAIIVPEGDDSPAIGVAHARGVKIIRLAAEPKSPAGEIRLSATAEQMCRSAGPTGPGDIAVILHTSGTTSRPKMIRLRHDQMLTSASNIANTLSLGVEDRCLNVMPLFHVHGLMASVFASLYAGGTVCCTRGFLAPRFFEWLDEQQSTWYSAVPTIHQAVLSRAALNRDIISRSQLRFVRSSSSALPTQVLTALENVLAVPVIEAYGMTEAAHQICSNPLPPSERKPGSVGRAAGCEVEIMSLACDELVGPNETGEVVIRGPNVADPHKSDVQVGRGWFRTGDQGHRDEDGYLFLTGRIKEMINRGGEKISPREIDDVLLDHPNIGQAVAFGVPDARLGEVVAAAVVLTDDGAATENEIREFVAERLVDYKVPEYVKIVPRIPMGDTGKLCRVGLAAAFGLDGSAVAELSPDFVDPQTEAEEWLVEMWRRVLGGRQVGTRHRFLDLGGDSMLAAQLVADIRDALGIELTIVDFFNAPTIAQQAAVVEGMLLEDGQNRGEVRHLVA